MTEQSAEPTITNLTNLTKRGASVPFSKEALAKMPGRIFSEEAIDKMRTAHPGGEQEKEERSNVNTTITIHETFESPTWKRPGTESYFREAQAAGYYGVDEATGEAYRVVDPADQRLKPKPTTTPAVEPGSLTWEDVDHEQAVLGPARVLVRANLPHIDEMSDGALGPIVDLAYEWAPADPGVYIRPGHVVWCPATPSGPQVPFPAVVVTVDPNKIAYKGPVKKILDFHGGRGGAQYRETRALLYAPASKPRKD